MSTRCYDTDLNDAAWAWIAPYLPAARPGGRPRTTDLRAVLNAIFYLLRTGCQWRLLPRSVPAPGHRLPLLSCLERCGRLGLKFTHLADTVGKREAQVPADRKQDHLRFKLRPFE